MTNPAPSHFDLSIAGAGVMGLACAYEASRHGRKVLVFDPGETAAQASSAAAGILVARDAQVFFSPFREFYVRSIRAYPEWLGRLTEAGGTAVPYHRGGDFMVFDLTDAASVKRLEEKKRQFEREKATAFTVSHELPPILRGHSRLEKVATLHFPDEAYVQNRDLLTALRKACEKAGVEFRRGATASPWTSNGEVTRIPFSDGEVTTRQVLIAAGAWSVNLLAAQGISAPMTPVKGQMIRIPRFHDGEAMIHFNDDMYLVPRGDSLIVGATSEPGVWQEGFDATGEAYLTERLGRLLPDAPRKQLENWTGIRPRTRDRLPWMGWVDAQRGWAICTGHYKSGISMAPLASECMHRLLVREKPAVDLAPFDPWRKQGLS